MLSLIRDNSRISSNMIIIMSCFFPLLLQNIHINVSVTLFNIFVLKYICFIFSYYSYYCSFLSIVVSYSQIGIIRYRTLYWIDNLLICIITHVIVHSFIHCCCCCSSFHFISLPDIVFEHIFLFSLSINDFDSHLQCYWNVLCCLLDW